MIERWEGWRSVRVPAYCADPLYVFKPYRIYSYGGAAPIPNCNGMTTSYSSGRCVVPSEMATELCNALGSACGAIFRLGANPATMQGNEVPHINTVYTCPSLDCVELRGPTLIERNNGWYACVKLEYFIGQTALPSGAYMPPDLSGDGSCDDGAHTSKGSR